MGENYVKELEAELRGSYRRVTQLERELAEARAERENMREAANDCARRCLAAEARLAERERELADAQEREAFNGNKWREEHVRAEAAEARLAAALAVCDAADDCSRPYDTLLRDLRAALSAPAEPKEAP